MRPWANVRPDFGLLCGNQYCFGIASFQRHDTCRWKLLHHSNLRQHLVPTVLTGQALPLGSHCDTDSIVSRVEDTPL